MFKRLLPALVLLAFSNAVAQPLPVVRDSPVWVSRTVFCSKAGDAPWECSVAPQATYPNRYICEEAESLRVRLVAAALDGRGLRLSAGVRCLEQYDA